MRNTQKIEFDFTKTKNRKYMFKIAKRIIKTEHYKQLPGRNRLIKDGYGSFVYYVKKYHHSLRIFRARLEGKKVLSEKESLEALMLAYINHD